MAQWIKAVVDTLPPPTHEQRGLLALIFRRHRGGRVIGGDQRRCVTGALSADTAGGIGLAQFTARQNGSRFHA
jgi:hypothetical protein